MLTNTLYQLHCNKTCTIGYFGGSITEGAGASSEATCYRARVTDWFRKQYPEAEIREIHAAIGGTGSDLGMYRLETDLLSKNPNLIFLEFAVNDSLSSWEDLLSQGETILRKLFNRHPCADVIIVLTTTGVIGDLLEKGDEYVSRTAYCALAHHYGLPVIDVGNILHFAVLRSGGDFMKYTIDRVHPNDDGYALYTQTITEHLAEWLDSSAVPASLTPHTIPVPLAAKLAMDARMVDFSELDALCANGFTVVEKSLCGRYPRYFEGTEPGASFSFTFIGRNVGFYWMLARDSGDVIVSVDDGEEQTLRSWDSYCKSFNRPGPAFFAHDLSYGTHTVRVKIASSKAEESEGHAIRIGCILIS